MTALISGSHQSSWKRRANSLSISLPGARLEKTSRPHFTRKPQSLSTRTPASQASRATQLAGAAKAMASPGESGGGQLKLAGGRPLYLLPYPGNRAPFAFLTTGSQQLGSAP